MNWWLWPAHDLPWRIELPVRCHVVTDERLIPAGPPFGQGSRSRVFAPGDRDVVCAEPMTAPANALATGRYALAPHSATFAVGVA